MKEQLITFETAKLAKEKGFDWVCLNMYHLDAYEPNKIQLSTITAIKRYIKLKLGYILLAPTQSLLQKFIRETRGVHIEIYRNASGYYWSMCKEEGGTDLGWSEYSGPNDGGVWDFFEDTLENALQIQLSYDLPNNMIIIKHWGNYVEFAIKAYNEN